MTWAVALLAVVVVALVAVVLQQGRNLSGNARSAPARRAASRRRSAWPARTQLVRSRVGQPGESGGAGGAAAARVRLRSGGRAVGGRHCGLQHLARLSRDDAKVEVVPPDVKNGKADLNQWQRRNRNAGEEKRDRSDVFSPQPPEPELEAADDVRRSRREWAFGRLSR